MKFGRSRRKKPRCSCLHWLAGSAGQTPWNSQPRALLSPHRSYCGQFLAGLPKKSSSKCFHNMLKRIPCSPLAKILVSSPRKNKPWTPDSFNTLRTTCGYVSCSACDCLYTFTTRIELLHVSDTAELQNPNKARRPSSANCVSWRGIFSDR